MNSVSALLLLCCLVLAGCTAPDATSPGASTGDSDASNPVANDPRSQPQREPEPVPVVHREAMLDNEYVVVEAGSYRYWGFTLPAAGTASYSVERRDGSSFNVCFIDEDEERYLEGGQEIRGYACHSNVAESADSAQLAPGNYDFVLWCQNSFADCDLSATAGFEYTTYE